MKLHRRLFSLLILLILQLPSLGQELNRTLIFKEGDKLYETGQYVKAMRFYAEVLDQDPNHKGSLYMMGECHRQMFDYESALPFYERVFKEAPTLFPLAGFHYAEMLKSQGEYNRALEGFELFSESLKNVKLHEDDRYRNYYKQARIEKEGCMLALNDQTNKKNDHNFRVSGSEINTPYMDFAAFTYGPNDEFMCLTSSRAAGKGNLIDYRFGESFADIYRYKKVNDVWKEDPGSDKLQKVINTKWGDGSGSFNKAGTKFYYTNCNEKLGDVCHIYVSVLKDGSWQEAVSLGETVNMPGFDSRHPNVSPTGDTLFFASTRPGGVGEYDIWMSLNLGGENWGQAQNLGDQINTPFLEVSPFYDPKQGALFFSSNGHRGFGGFDIYMAKGNSFLDAEIFNPGAPYNTNKDEIFMFISSKMGYLSSNRLGGPGKLDIYEFDIATPKEIVAEISKEKGVAGRNSLFTDDYEFDSENVTAINEIISNFLAAKQVDVSIALSDNLAKVYNSLSLDDKEKINRIILARVRQLNERDLEALRIEDEFYYQDLNSDDRSNVDNLITRYIEEDGLALSVALGAKEKAFFRNLPTEDKEKVDHLVATRVKQASSYNYEPVIYKSLSENDKKQVDALTLRYLEDKTSLDKMKMSPAQTYYLNGLPAEQKAKVMASVKEQLLDLSDNPKYKITEDDRIFYQNLSTEHLEVLRRMASAYMTSDMQNLGSGISASDLKLFQLYSAGQQVRLNKILVKMISNTIKADLYFAEANLSSEEKASVHEIDKTKIPEFVNKTRASINEATDKDRLLRFMTITAPIYNQLKPTFIVPAAPPVVSVPVPKPIETGDTRSGDSNALKAGQSGAGGGGQGASGAQQVTGPDEVTKAPEVKATPVIAKVEKEQKIESLSTEDLNFYESLPIDKKKVVDRIIGFEYLISNYKSAEMGKSDDVYLKSLPSDKQTYVSMLSKAMTDQGTVESPSEKVVLKEAYAYYSKLSPVNKATWNRLILRDVLIKDGERYRLSPTDESTSLNFSESEKLSLKRLKEYRSGDQRVISETLITELSGGTGSYDLAKFNSEGYNHISVSGILVNKTDGKPMSDYPLVVVNDQVVTVAKTTTSVKGEFNFEDLPKGEYKVAPGKAVTSKENSAPFLVKDLKVQGSEVDRFATTKLVNIYFDFDSELVRPEAQLVLKEIADLCKKYSIYVELKSHTDNVGADDYNLNLSNKRIDQTLDLLKKGGVKGEKIEWLAMGKSSPVAQNSTAYGRQFNRRIEILLKSEQPIDYTPMPTYLIRPKGTLFSIAKNFEVSVEDIQRANGMTASSTLKAYSPLRVPNPKNLRPNLDMLVELNESVAISHNLYQVKSGDTTASIAEKFNIPEELILEMNNLKSKELTTGQQLKIYIRN